MKNPFKKNTPATPPADAAPAAPEFDPVKMRETVFATLSTRVGPEMAAVLREDFDHHIAEDPVNGVEAAWMCLCGKLVETIDRFNDLLNGTMPPGLADALGGFGAGPASSGGNGPINPFTTFRKDG